MSVTCKIFQHLELNVGGELKEAGSRTVAEEVTVDGYVFETRAAVPDNYLDQILWTAGDGGIDDFDVLYVESDEDIFLELRNTQATDEFVLLEVKAGVPLILRSDDVAGYQSTTRLDDAELVEATDYDQVDRITAQRNVADDEGDATVRLLLIT
jgi:hypothetical protein